MSLKKLDQVVELVVGGFVINGACPKSPKYQGLKKKKRTDQNMFISIHQ